MSRIKLALRALAGWHPPAGRQTSPEPLSPRWQAALYEDAARSTAELVARHLSGALIFPSVLAIRDHAIDAAPADGLLIECGVFGGTSINRFASQLEQRGDVRTVYGFDTFEGLVEDWTGTQFAAGKAFDRGGVMPRVLPGVSLIRGRVEETVPAFLAREERPIALLHIDTDTYTPAVAVLRAAIPYLVKGSLILFDELIGFPNWQLSEFRALKEVVPEHRYDFAAFGPEQALVRVVC